MLGSFRWILFVFVGLVVLVAVLGCGEREHRKVRVTQEERPGEVREVPPGEMVVE